MGYSRSVNTSNNFRYLKMVGNPLPGNNLDPKTSAYPNLFSTLLAIHPIITWHWHSVIPFLNFYKLAN